MMSVNDAATLGGGGAGDTYGLRQWAAVSTCWSVMRVPPQYWALFVLRSRAAIHGQSLGSAGFPPTMRLKSDFLELTPHPAKYLMAVFKVLGES